MKVMTLHKFFDEDVEEVLWNGHEDVREIVMVDAALLINKADAIAIAKEFGLVVYDRESAL